MNVATPAVLNIKDLLSRVDNDRELVSELFFIFKSVFPSHLQRLSAAVSKELPKQVEAESPGLFSCGPRDKPLGRLVEARENMRFKATHDSLTSLFNRGVIVELLGREISRSRRERVPTAILLCDVDNFKPINDSHGHLVGDEVLQEAARRLLLSVRSYDYVGRYGGEEFLIILNNCDPASAPRRAEEIRRSLSDTPVQTSIGPLLVTMSMGVHQTENWGVRTVEELLHQVDLAMYAAKAAGRNRISFTKPENSPNADDVTTTEAEPSVR